jgi:hypothetical protein
MNGLRWVPILCNLVVIAAISMGGVARAAPDPDSVQYEQQIELNGESSVAKVRHVDYQQTLKSQEGKEYVQRLRDVVLEMRPHGNALDSHIIWWQTSPIASKGVVTGEPIYAIDVLSVDEVDFLVLVIANSYYHGARVIVIDPQQKLRDPPSHKSVDRAAAAQARVWEAKSAVISHSLGSKAGGSYGTRTLDVATEDGEIVLVSVDASGKKRETTISLEESGKETLQARAKLRREERR